MIDPKLILAELEDLAQRLGLTVRYEKLGDEDTEVHSGRCRLKGEEILLMDKRLTPADRVKILSQELAHQDLSGIYIKPMLKKYLGVEDNWD